MKVISKIVLISTLVLVQSCTFEVQNIQIDSIEEEVKLLTTESELETLYQNNPEVVEWTLSKEFAEYTLTGFITSGEFPVSSSLWEMPVAIYDRDGNIRYYEYRVVSEEKTIGAIVCNANEKLGAPIAFVLHKDGYTDEIEELYKQGKFSKNELPRIIDNGYPNVVIAGASLRSNGGINYNTAYDIESGEKVEQIAVAVSFEEYIREYPDILSESQKKEIAEAIENYKAEISDMWALAKENKGNIVTRGWWGGSSSGDVGSVDFPNEMTIEEFNDKYKKHRHPDTDIELYKIGYYACGGSAAGYILDTLALKGIGNVSEIWLKMDNITSYPKSKCALHLIELMEMTPFLGQYITWPNHIGDAISKYSDYKTTYTFGIPKKSVDNGIPGISLKVSWYGNGMSGHYRNVVAYESRGWGIFKWDYELIRDINYLDDGQWEAVNPFIHWMSWNVQHK